MRGIIAALMLLSFVVSANASCDDDTIRDKSSDGSIIIMQSGHMYRVSIYDRIDSSSWIQSDEVIVCDDEIINKDENGEKVDAELIR